MEESLYSILARFQKLISVPKDSYNQFGKYKYRTAEGILEAIKNAIDYDSKTLSDYGYSVTLKEDIVHIGDRYYVRCEAIISNGKESISTTAFAQEPADKKGMDVAQITGASTSYARKYALGGLFAIDSSEHDPDVTNKHQEKQITQDQIEVLKNLLMELVQLGGTTKDGSPLTEQAVCAKFGKSVFSDLTWTESVELVNLIKQMISRKK